MVDIDTDVLWLVDAPAASPHPPRCQQHISGRCDQPRCAGRLSRLQVSSLTSSSRLLRWCQADDVGGFVERTLPAPNSVLATLLSGVPSEVRHPTPIPPTARSDAAERDIAELMYTRPLRTRQLDRRGINQETGPTTPRAMVQPRRDASRAASGSRGVPSSAK